MLLGPYFLGQSLLLVVTASVIEGLRLWGIDPAESLTISFSVCAVISYVMFGFGAGQRRRRLGRLRCEHFDGRNVRYVELPLRRKRAAGAPSARG